MFVFSIKGDCEGGVDVDGDDEDGGEDDGGKDGNHTNLYQPIPTHKNPNQPIPNHQPIPTHINLNQPVPTCTNPYQAISVQKVSFDKNENQKF